MALVLLMCMSAVANAQTTTPINDQVANRPNKGGRPDVITVSLGLVDIVGIEDREQRYDIDAYAEVSWHDARLALAGDTGRTDRLRMVQVTEIWTPHLLILNDRGLKFLLPEVVTIDPDGNVVLRQRLAGPLAVNLDLHKFPFDTQRLTIDVVSYLYSPSEIAYSEDSQFIASVESFSADDWMFEPLDPELSVYRLSEDGVGRPMLTFAVLATRDAGFYVLTLALPMTLILFLAWMVHWLPANITPARISMAGATVFSLIAFGVGFRLSLPKIAYLTQADRFVVYSTMLVAVSLAVAVITARHVARDREAEANQLARRATLAFPLAYFVIIILTFV